MRENVKNDVQPPGKSLPERFPEDHPQERERDKEDDQAVRDVVRAMDVGRNERRIRGLARKVRTFSEAEEPGEKKGTEGKQVRENAEAKRQPEVPPVVSSEGNTAPESM